MTFTPVHLRRAGVSLLVVPTPGGFPAILHWGRDLGDLTEDDIKALLALHEPGIPGGGSFDEPRWVPAVPDVASGFSGRPALEGRRSVVVTTALRPAPRDWKVAVEPGQLGDTAILTGVDAEAGWQVVLTLTLTSAGLLHARTTVTNLGPGELDLGRVETLLPIGPGATELLHLTGRWSDERVPQRQPLAQGVVERASRRGRTGHDATLLMVAGAPGFGFERGECWSVHVAWSGNHLTRAERTSDGECLLGGGELLEAGEVTLGEGESYDSPWLSGAWSGAGLNTVAARMHDDVRRHEPDRPAARKVLVNTWEAVYFDHDLESLRELAVSAAELGIERFVLDDGWFRGRRNDRAGLGDWEVDTDVWPGGLGPLVEAVHAAGLDFGLWVEPEMVNPDSDTARAHPDWLLRGRSSLPLAWRHQHVLDLQVPEAYDHVRRALDALLTEYDIAYLKWDHNRDLTDPTHEGRPAVAGQTRAYYRLLDELRAAHPGLEIESCASGGGRIDAEVLRHTNRVWTSDTLDPVQRFRMQPWTGLLVPPELLGSHVGAATAHTTGRTTTLAYRAAATLLHHAGVEVDVRRLDQHEREELAAWLELHRRVRPLIPTGRYHVADHPDPALVLTGVVAPDASEAWFVLATTDPTEVEPPHPVRLPGLAPAATYRLTDRTPASSDRGARDRDGYRPTEPRVTTGAALSFLGVRPPTMPPLTARVWHLEQLAD